VWRDRGSAVSPAGVAGFVHVENAQVTSSGALGSARYATLWSVAPGAGALAVAEAYDFRRPAGTESVFEGWRRPVEYWGAGAEAVRRLGWVVSDASGEIVGVGGIIYDDILLGNALAPGVRAPQLSVDPDSNQRPADYQAARLVAPYGVRWWAAGNPDRPTDVYYSQPGDVRAGWEQAPGSPNRDSVAAPLVGDAAAVMAMYELANGLAIVQLDGTVLGFRGAVPSGQYPLFRVARTRPPAGPASVARTGSVMWWMAASGEGIVSASLDRVDVAQWAHVRPVYVDGVASRAVWPMRAVGDHETERLFCDYRLDLGGLPSGRRSALHGMLEFHNGAWACGGVCLGVDVDHGLVPGGRLFRVRSVEGESGGSWSTSMVVEVRDQYLGRPPRLDEVWSAQLGELFAGWPEGDRRFENSRFAVLATSEALVPVGDQVRCNSVIVEVDVWNNDGYPDPLLNVRIVGGGVHDPLGFDFGDAENVLASPWVPGSRDGRPAPWLVAEDLPEVAVLAATSGDAPRRLRVTVPFPDGLALEARTFQVLLRFRSCAVRRVQPQVETAPVLQAPLEVGF